SVLEIGSGFGDLLSRLNPSKGVGLDISPLMVAAARKRHPSSLTFYEGDAGDAEVLAKLRGRFDYVIMADTIGALDDCQTTLENLHRFCRPDTRIIVAYYSRLWEPAFWLAEKLNLKQKALPQNWLSTDDIRNLLHLAGFDTIKREWRVLVPWRALGIGRFVNRFIATLPLARRLCLRSYVIARPAPKRRLGNLSATVLVPCRNERGNIEAAVIRTPKFCEDMEILYVEGGSSDGTWDEIQRVIKAYPDRKIHALKQPGKGKGDAVRAGLAAAENDVLMILDADLTMPPEDLPKFYDALVSGRGEYINGSRMVYPMEKEAMRILNYVANRVFGWLFSYLLNQRYTDTLCGTKVLRKKDYERIAANRAYFGKLDPFGCFDLIFGASKLNLKTAEVYIRYAAREYGETQISRFLHGWLLLRMVILAYRKFKAL
ncbi:MAG: glycosyltransferase, partial [Rhodospirillaceae bacterium]|nr:glycosyltransferase [Rhodospirillaceae bacterium]